MDPNTYYIKTFGCQMNDYDSQRISFLVEKVGYIPAISEEQSDLIIINTCAVREKANQRFLSYLGNLKKLKNTTKNPLICVCGCTTQQLKEELIRKYPYIDIAIGPRSTELIPKMLKKIEKNKKTITDFDLKRFDDDLLKNKNDKRFSAYIPVIVGCNNFCSYCIVPYVRGREKSIPSRDVIKRCKELVSAGTVEITLLGQNVNSYGKDIDGEITFARLLESVSKINGLKRLRFMTSHPKDFSDDLIEVISDNKNIMKHIHLPLQSGSDKVLRLMNRGYDTNKYIATVNNIKDKIPDCSITTDIIVGFPGEKYEDFKETLDIVSQVSFLRAFTFIYSERAGTKALKLKDEIKPEDKKRWFEELLKLQNSISLEINSQFLGGKLEVLVEGFSAKSKGVLTGRLENNLLVNFKGKRELIGNFRKVYITDRTPFYLIGKLIQEEDEDRS